MSSDLAIYISEADENLPVALGLLALALCCSTFVEFKAQASKRSLPITLLLNLALYTLIFGLLCVLDFIAKWRGAWLGGSFIAIVLVPLLFGAAVLFLKFYSFRVAGFVFRRPLLMSAIPLLFLAAPYMLYMAYIVVLGLSYSI